MSHAIYNSYFWDNRIEVLKNRGISPLTAIDIGANIGEWAVDFKRHFPNANVLSIEANIQLEQQLKANNPNYLITLLGREINDKVKFYINPGTDNDTGASIYRETTQWGNNAMEITLPMTTLDSLGKRFDWIKIDVQGAELDVLNENTTLNQLIKLYEDQITQLEVMSKIELGDDVIEEIKNSNPNYWGEIILIIILVVS